MNVKRVDNDLAHLYPVFREKLLTVLAEVEQATGEPWKVVEGLRTQERQNYLYAQGRTRPGKVVTWIRSPRWHGTGLAVDVVPSRSGYGAPHSHWTTLRRIYHRHGLDNPAWGNGDLGHIQLSDAALRQKALAWVRAGFPVLASEKPAPRPEIPVYVAGELIPDADGFSADGRTMLALRPVCEALGWLILDVEPTRALVVNEGGGEGDRECWLPLEIRAGCGFVQAVGLEPLGCRVRWDGTARVVRIEEHR